MNIFTHLFAKPAPSLADTVSELQGVTIKQAVAKLQTAPREQMPMIAGVLVNIGIPAIPDILTFLKSDGHPMAKFHASLALECMPQTTEEAIQVVKQLTKAGVMLSPTCLNKLTQLPIVRGAVVMNHATKFGASTKTQPTHNAPNYPEQVNIGEITFDCPHCTNHLIVDQRGAGMQGSCPHCSQSITIPSQNPRSAPQVLKSAEAVALSTPEEDFERALRSSGGWEDSIRILTMHIERDANAADAYFWRAAAHFARAIQYVNERRPLSEIVPHCERAIADYTHVTVLEPMNVKAYANRYGVHQSLARDVEAGRDLKAIEQLVALGHRPDGEVLNSPTLREWIINQRTASR
jgi:hypothetical protein